MPLISIFSICCPWAVGIKWQAKIFIHLFKLPWFCFSPRQILRHLCHKVMGKHDPKNLENFNALAEILKASLLR